MGLDLADAWQMALAMAWHSYLAGTTPVGAVVVDSSGYIVASGRSRRHDPLASDQQLSHSRIAHAEVNALALLSPDEYYEDHVLVSTLEPCCMCLGAAVQSTVSQVRYAGRDPYAGASRLLIDTPQARRRPLAIEGPLPDLRGRFAELIHIRWMLDVGASMPVLAEHEWSMPDLYHTAARPSTADLFAAFRQDSASVDEAIDETAELLE